jgi:hypothetical protein
MNTFEIIYGIFCALIFGSGLIFWQLADKQMKESRKLLENAKLEHAKAKKILSACGAIVIGKN